MNTLLRPPAAVFLLLVCAFAPRARGEVVDSSASGFTVRNRVRIAATPEAVYDRVVRDVGGWWNPAHTFSGDALNLSIDDKAGGCFCEKLKGGGSVRHMTVVYANPGKILRLEGGLGPLQSMGVAGVLTWTLTPDAGGTVLELTYCVGGYTPGGLQRISSMADRMLNEQVGRLKNLIEMGDPSGGGKK